MVIEREAGGGVLSGACVCVCVCVCALSVWALAEVFSVLLCVWPFLCWVDLSTYIHSLRML